MNLRRTRAMFQKEVRHILRDSRSLIMALFLPLFQMLLFGYALNHAGLRRRPQRRQSRPHRTLPRFPVF